MANASVSDGDWVEVRAHHSVHAIFDGLVDQMRSDLDRANQLDPPLRFHRRFESKVRGVEGDSLGQSVLLFQWRSEHPGEEDAGQAGIMGISEGEIFVVFTPLGATRPVRYVSTVKLGPPGVYLVENWETDESFSVSSVGEISKVILEPFIFGSP